MATSLTVNGVSYLYPDTGDQSWGTVASAWATAITTGVLQKAGGTFALTADVKFGSSFGIFSQYFTSNGANPAATGAIRLSNIDSICWRNNANSGDVALEKNSSDQLTWAGVVISSAAGVTPVAAGGTGLTSGTSGGILGYTATGTLASSALLAANQLVIGGGAGATPLTLAAGSQYQVLVMGASNPGYGQVNLAQSAAVTGVLPNANTTATNLNTLSAIVARDGSGNFSAGTITASLTGVASGNTTYTANQFGLVASGSGNAMSVIAPNASTVFPLISGGASSNPSWAALTLAGLASAAYASAATASVLMQRDANANVRANNFIDTFATTVTAAGTTVLTVSSAYLQQFTGSTTQTITLPVTSTLVQGQSFAILNRSTGNLTVNSSGGNLVQSVTPGSQVICTCSLITGTTAASWDAAYSIGTAGTGTVTSVTFTGDGTILSSTPSGAVTTAGTVTASLIAQSKNTFLGGPASGSSASPTFRTLGLLDIPLVTWATKTSNYTVLSTDWGLLASSTSAFSLTLPSASSNSGKLYYIKNINTGVITILPNGSDVIDGESSQILNMYGGVILISDGGSNWYAF